MSLLLLLACATLPDTGDSPADTDTGEPVADGPEWDPLAAELPCDEGGSAPLLDAALLDAGLDRDDLGFRKGLWTALANAGYVAGPYQWPFFEAVHHEPEHAACWARQHAADLDFAAVAPHPVAAALGVEIAAAGLQFDGYPLDPGDTTLAEALAELVDQAGGGDDPAAAADVPEELATALVPIVLALAEGIEVRHRMDVASASVDKPGKLFRGAAGMVISSFASFPPLDADEFAVATAWATSDDGPRALLLPARRLAYAVEDADLARFVGGDTDWRFATAAGLVHIAPGTDDAHAETDAVLFRLELGGNDTYTDPVGATTDDENPVSLNVDLGGDDIYGYEVVPDGHDADGLLPSDEDGRSSAGAGMYPSASDIGRQGSGRYGIGLAFDLGAGHDVWSSLRMSQGFGALGVGVLRDDGGDDVYQAEAGAQGSSVFGWGLLVDGGGDDAYTSWAYSQGFGYSGGVGELLDAGGDDVYTADPGNNFGGTTLYYSPQLPGGEGNSSFCQGAGFGLRGDSYGIWISGGLGVLRDVQGNDSYANGVFGQGTGYWEGTGLLSDGAGDDEYDALYYMQGGVAHFATGLLFDNGGNDRYNQRFDSYYMQTGAGHDYSLGMIVDDGGDDVWGYNGLAAGASNCQGVGIFVDKDGADTYVPRSAYSTGLGNHSTECEARTDEPSIGIFLDSGGDVDTWTWPDASRAPADDSSFGIEWNGTDDEHGGAVDGDGVTGF